jgi:hypothetical protein
MKNEVFSTISDCVRHLLHVVRATVWLPGVNVIKLVFYYVLWPVL